MSMNKSNTMPSSLFLAILLLISCSTSSLVKGHSSAPAADQSDHAKQLQTYIVHVRPPPARATLADARSLEDWYRSFLPMTTKGSGESRMIYSYTEVISGFAARLSVEEVEQMAKKDGFRQAHPERVLPLHTTHTPDFMGLHVHSGLWKDAGKGVIIAMIDTGIMPFHPSFGEHDMPPPPNKWNGTCAGLNGTAVCNNKLIGARSFLGESALDFMGHGTHTASTAAGNFVKNANVLGMGSGTAVGMAPRAHLAAYKVCGVMCRESNVLAGMDAAINDGADVLSISLGGTASRPFYSDSIAIGAFAATKKGIFVSCSAGNSGPSLGSVTNEAPWMLTIGASTIDRRFTATVKLGDGQEFNGEAVFQPSNFSSTPLPIAFPGSQNFKSFDRNCGPGKKLKDVGGAVVLCWGASSGVLTERSVSKKGGAAMIMMNTKLNGYTTIVDADQNILPVAHVSYAVASKIISYLNSTRTPTASITFKGTTLKISPAPTVAFFSSRGPSTANRGILKPDIIGPGVNILAAWHRQVEHSRPAKHDNMTFNVLSGTSMAAPHLSGIAALVKSVHPDWSAAAIKSAIMTTATTKDLNGNPIRDEQHGDATAYAIGAGHVNPLKVADPGLVYDIDTEDYIAYLCGLNYTDKQVGAIIRGEISCSKSRNISAVELNYPSIQVQMGFYIDLIKVNRTVTNVGEARETYKAVTETHGPMVLRVQPETLEFSGKNEKKSFTVSVYSDKRTSTVATRINGPDLIAEGSLTWVSDKHVVRIPIVIN